MKFICRIVAMTLFIGIFVNHALIAPSLKQTPANAVIQLNKVIKISNLNKSYIPQFWVG